MSKARQQNVSHVEESLLELYQILLRLCCPILLHLTNLSRSKYYNQLKRGTFCLIIIFYMRINIKKEKNRYETIKTQPDLQQPILRSSLGQDAKQNLRQISQICNPNKLQQSRVDWSQIEEFSNRYPTEKGCFEINLAKIKMKKLLLDSSRIPKSSLNYCSSPSSNQVKPPMQVQNNQYAKKTNRLKTISESPKRAAASFSYLFDCQFKQYGQPIHSFHSSKRNTCNSGFLPNQQTFKRAATNLYQYKISHTSRRSSKIQSSLIAHKKKKDMYNFIEQKSHIPIFLPFKRWRISHGSMTPISKSTLDPKIEDFKARK